MIIDCQLKCLLKNYLKSVIVGFGQADVLGYRIADRNLNRQKPKQTEFNKVVCTQSS